MTQEEKEAAVCAKEPGGDPCPGDECEPGFDALKADQSSNCQAAYAVLVDCYVAAPDDEFTCNPPKSDFPGIDPFVPPESCEDEWDDFLLACPI